MLQGFLSVDKNNPALPQQKQVLLNDTASRDKTATLVWKGYLTPGCTVFSSWPGTKTMEEGVILIFMVQIRPSTDLKRPFSKSTASLMQNKQRSFTFFLQEY